MLIGKVLRESLRLLFNEVKSVLLRNSCYFGKLGLIDIFLLQRFFLHLLSDDLRKIVWVFDNLLDLIGL